MFSDKDVITMQYEMMKMEELLQNVKCKSNSQYEVDRIAEFLSAIREFQAYLNRVY